MPRIKKMHMLEHLEALLKLISDINHKFNEYDIFQEKKDNLCKLENSKWLVFTAIEEVR